MNITAHVCQGSVKSVGVFVDAESCSSMSENQCTNIQHNNGYNRTPCCKDLHFSVPNGLYEDVEFTTAGSVVEFSPVETQVVSTHGNCTEFTNSFKTNYDPPDPFLKQAQVLFQVYTI